MNDEPNTIDWEKGDIVIHDADRTCREMLMVVTSYNKNDGLYRTKYVFPAYVNAGRIYWRNEKKYLHDPKRFGINITGLPNGGVV